MWKHQILTDLDRIVEKVGSGGEHFYVQNAKLLSVAIKNSPCIHCGEFSAYRNIMQKLEGTQLDFNEIKFPYDNFLMTYERSASDPTLEVNEDSSSRRAIFLGTNFFTYSRVAFSMSYFDKWKIWMIDPCMSCYYHGSSAVSYMPTSNQHDKLTDKWCKDHAQEVSTAVAILNVLHCKNVRLAPVEAPLRLNKKRIKGGKHPIFEYHILTVDLNKGNSERSDSTGEAIGIMPVHLCRGHFKEYSEDKPLFGKYAGRYWWQPYARGKAEQGIVTKDYQLKISANQPI